MIYVATLNGLTKPGEDALRRSVDPPMHRIVRQGLSKAGIKQTQTIATEKPQLVVEWRFVIGGVSKYAFSGTKGFQWWQEQFEDKLKHFDKAEQVIYGKDYTISWRQEE
jgi:hypothetical protein